MLNFWDNRFRPEMKPGTCALCGREDNHCGQRSACSLSPNRNGCSAAHRFFAPPRQIPEMLLCAAGAGRDIAAAKQLNTYTACWPADFTPGGVWTHCQHFGLQARRVKPCNFTIARGWARAFRARWSSAIWLAASAWLCQTRKTRQRFRAA